MKKSLDSYRLNLHLGANGKIHSNAKDLRENLTDAEQILWEELRDRKIELYKFRRQHPIMQFIADFYCHELKMVIELDGGIHQKKSVAESDAGRMFELAEHGLIILRFSNDEVYYDLNGVLEEIRKAIKERKG